MKSSCENCKHRDNAEDTYPCDECRTAWGGMVLDDPSKWEERKDNGKVSQKDLPRV